MRHALVVGDVKQDSAADAVLNRVAGALGEVLDTDAQLHSLLAQLQRLGVSISVHLTLVSGADRPLVTVDAGAGVVPEWSGADQEFLRSLGINADDGKTRHRLAKPGRRQPR
jgi:hypothetical protein